ncbi:MAG: hypothetical protein V1897_08355 [Pseudomonadota bacterium]
MKSFTLKLVLFLVVCTVGASVFASGFRCISDSGYKLKIYNHVNAEDGTRIPGVLVLSDSRGTLFTAKGSEISKRNLSDVVQYTVHVEDTDLQADYVIAQIRFKEGRETLREGEKVIGSLIFSGNGEREYSAMICSRYLKNGTF